MRTQPARAANVTIRPVDPWDDQELAALQSLYEQAVLHGNPHARVVGLAETTGVLRGSSAEQFYTSFAAERDGEIVGQSLIMGRLTDNTHTATVLVWVAPQHARRGGGSALVRHAEEHVRGLGRADLRTETWLDRGRAGADGYRAFAERLGFVLQGHQIERKVDLPIDPHLLESLAAEASAHHGDYRVQVHEGPIPDALAAPYCDLYNHLSVEMPSTDPDVEATRRTPEALKAQDQYISDSGHTRLTVYAATADGDWAAGTTLIIDPTTQTARQWWTLVHPGHRGHRLGLAVKVRQLQEVARRHPLVTSIATQNAEVNQHMIEINDRLGFTVRSIDGEFAKDLGAPDRPGVTDQA